MVFGVVAVFEPEQVVPFVIRTDAPGDRLVRVAPVVKKKIIQVGAAVPEMIGRQEVRPGFQFKIKPMAIVAPRITISISLWGCR